MKKQKKLEVIKNSVEQGGAADLVSEFLKGRKYSKIFILTDENTRENCISLIVPAVDALNEAEILEIEPGEASKTLAVAEQLWNVMNELGADRYSLLINLGGGVVTDLGGFVASVYKRGIDYVHIPTSLLAQVDAAIGGKNGIDMGPVKNVIGTFSEPAITIIDSEFLRTLSTRELLCGLAEMAKHALVVDARYWKSIKAKSYRKIEHFLALIPRSVQIKQAIVANDSHEMGERKILNFGHTIGHAVEGFALESAMDLKHGEAVAVGIICETHISWKRGWLSKAELEEISTFFLKHFTHVKFAIEQHERVLELMRHDKKNRGGSIRMSLLKGIGKCKTDVEVNAVEVMRALKYYQGLI